LGVLLWRGPKDEQSAQRWRDVPRKLAVAGLPPPAPEDYLRRVRQLRRLRLHAMLREEFDPERLPDLPPEAANAIGQTWFWALGRGHYFTQALQALESETVRRRFALQTRDVLTLSVEYYLRAGQAEIALARLEALELEAPQAYVLPGYYLDLARRARTRGDNAGMERWCTRVIERFAGHPRWVESYWLLFWDRYRAGRWEEAVRWAEPFLAGGADLPGRDRIQYWLGRAYAALARKDESARVWGTLALESPNSFYGLLAQGETVERLTEPRPRLRAIPLGEGSSAAPPALATLWEEPRLRIPLLLAILGEDALGEAAVDSAIALPAPEPALRELGAALIHLHKYHLAQKLAVRYLRPGPGASIDAETMRLVYPLAYWEQIAGGAGERLSPFFVLAVIREESHFREDADSSAGAKGLMQLMPSTAMTLAKDHGLPQDEVSLLRPEVNIALGKLYLEGLRKRFAGNPIHIAASYNAGPTIVREWLRTMANLPLDEFVEAIPYEETATYVKKVLATSMMYRRIYASD
jgi:soluble lytic murein transglycosylase